MSYVVQDLYDDERNKTVFQNTTPDLQDQDQDRFFGLRPVSSSDRRSQTTSLITMPNDGLLYAKERLLSYLLTYNLRKIPDWLFVSTRISNLRLNISSCGSSTSLDTLVVTTICGDACPLSCVSAEACFTGWPNAQHIGGLRSSIPIGGWRMMDRPVSATHARGTYDENSFSYPRRIR